MIALSRFFFVIAFIFALSSTTFSSELDSVLARGDSCLNIVWTADSANTDPTWYTTYGFQCTGSDTLFLHCDFIPGNKYYGIAYSYGGEDPWYTFRSKIDSGYPAGSHLCHYKEYGDPSDTIAGTDCSGFLCFIWNIPRMSTSGIASSTLLQKIDQKDIHAGDGLVRPGYHCVFVVEADDPSEMVIWEASSTVFSVRERVTDISQPYWTPYQAIRNPAVTSIFNKTKKSVKNISSLVSIQVLSSGAIQISSRYDRPVSLRIFTLQGRMVSEKNVPAFKRCTVLQGRDYSSNGMYLFRFTFDGRGFVERKVVLY